MAVAWGLLRHPLSGGAGDAEGSMRGARGWTRLPVGEGDGGAAAPNLSHRPCAASLETRAEVPHASVRWLSPMGALCRPIGIDGDLGLPRARQPASQHRHTLPLPPPQQPRACCAFTAPWPAGFPRVAWVITCRLHEPAAETGSGAGSPSPAGGAPPAATACHLLPPACPLVWYRTAACIQAWMLGCWARV